MREVRIHPAYNQEAEVDERGLVPGEISRGCPNVWQKPGVVVASVSDFDTYVYDPEMRVAGNEVTGYVVWNSPGGKGFMSDGSGWHYVEISQRFTT
jgi:hypothetical protein